MARGVEQGRREDFVTLHESTDQTTPPALETEGAANLNIGRPDWVSLEAVLVRLLAAEDYRVPHATCVPKAASGKYAMALDEPRGQVCYLALPAVHPLRPRLLGQICHAPAQARRPGGAGIPAPARRRRRHAARRLELAAHAARRTLDLLRHPSPAIARRRPGPGARSRASHSHRPSRRTRWGRAIASRSTTSSSRTRGWRIR